MHNDAPVHRDPLVTAQALPPSFILGTATASAQIEGATRIGRRTPSVWDRFAAEPGRILDGSTTAVTADHYHRYREDVRAMKELGVDAYRLSLGWTRLQPEGTGPLDAGGIDFYDRLLDELCQAGISPFVTLSHWDIPVQYEGGWLSRDTAKRLGDFAGLVAQRFADRVDGWITINEPATVTLNGYALDIHTPVVPASDSAEDAAMAELPFRLEAFPEYPTTGFGWPIAPEYFAVTLKEVQDRYGERVPPIYTTENGASFADEVGEDGKVRDAQRTAYLADHLGTALAAVAPGGVAEGIDLRGYFAWSLLDNWEWAAGFTQRFGIIHVDFETGERTPKASYDWLAEVSRLRPRS